MSRVVQITDGEKSCKAVLMWFICSFFQTELGSAILSESMDNAQINFKSKRLLRKWKGKIRSRKHVYEGKNQIKIQICLHWTTNSNYMLIADLSFWMNAFLEKQIECGFSKVTVRSGMSGLSCCVAWHKLFDLWGAGGNIFGISHVSSIISLSSLI